MHYHWKHPFAIGDKVRCFAPEGWGGHQGNLLDQVAYFGEGLDEYGMPKHGTLYCVRGFDHTCDKPAVYLAGIIGAKRPDGSEMSFSAKGFLTPSQYAEAVRGTPVGLAAADGQPLIIETSMTTEKPETVAVGSAGLLGASKRRLLVSRSMGVYLGSCMGMGFWSKLDPVDQPSAVTFDSAETIRNVMAEWDGLGSLPSDMIFPEVEDADGDGYATEAECVAAGVDPWISPNDEVSRAHLNTKQDGA